MTALVTFLIGLASKLGVKAAQALVPYAVALTPVAVLIGAGAALYLTHKGDAVDLTLMGLVVANEAVVAAQLAGKAAPAKS